MIYIVYGAVGFLAVLLLFSAGVFAGWKLRLTYDKHNQRVVVEAATEEEKKRAKEEQDAFSSLMGYNINMAYGIDDTVESLLKREG